MVGIQKTKDTTAPKTENMDGNEAHDNMDEKTTAAAAVSEEKDKDNPNGTCDNETDKVESKNGKIKDTSTDQAAVDAQVVKNETKPETKNNNNYATTAKNSGVTTATENSTLPPSDAKTANSVVDTTAVEAINSTTVAALETTCAMSPTIVTETIDPAVTDSNTALNTLVLLGAAIKVVATFDINHWKVVDGALVVVIEWEGKFKNAQGAVATVEEVVAVLVKECYQDVMDDKYLNQRIRQKRGNRNE